MVYTKGQATIDINWSDNIPAIQLPHSCDEWIIGSPNQARQLVLDLEVLIIKLEAQLSNSADALENEL